MGEAAAGAEPVERMRRFRPPRHGPRKLPARDGPNGIATHRAHVGIIARLQDPAGGVPCRVDQLAGILLGRFGHRCRR